MNINFTKNLLSTGKVKEEINEFTKDLLNKIKDNKFDTSSLINKEDYKFNEEEECYEEDYFRDLQNLHDQVKIIIATSLLEDINFATGK